MSNTRERLLKILKNIGCGCCGEMDAEVALPLVIALFKEVLGEIIPNRNSEDLYMKSEYLHTRACGFNECLNQLDTNAKKVLGEEE